MRRLGGFLLAGGLTGFLITSSYLSYYDSVGKPTKSSSASVKQARGIESAFEKVKIAREEAWEMARWLFAGVGVIGITFLVLPGRKI